MAKKFKVHDDNEDIVKLVLVDQGDGAVALVDSDGLEILTMRNGQVELVGGLDGSGYEVDRNGYVKVVRI